MTKSYYRGVPTDVRGTIFSILKTEQSLRMLAWAWGFLLLSAGKPAIALGVTVSSRTLTHIKIGPSFLLFIFDIYMQP